jgi:hypothetical protein
MKGAAFDALEKNPGVFVQRYLAGDDCALLLLLYAYDWPMEGPEVGGIDCADHGKRALARFDKAMSAATRAMTSSKVPESLQGKPRGRLIVELASDIDEAWSSARLRVTESCEETKN